MAPCTSQTLRLRRLNKAHHAPLASWPCNGSERSMQSLQGQAPQIPAALLALQNAWKSAASSCDHSHCRYPQRKWPTIIIIIIAAIDGRRFSPREIRSDRGQLLESGPSSSYNIKVSQFNLPNCRELKHPLIRIRTCT